MLVRVHALPDARHAGALQLVVAAVCSRSPGDGSRPEHHVHEQPSGPDAAHHQHGQGLDVQYTHGLHGMQRPLHRRLVGT